MPQVMVPYADSQGVPQFVGVYAQNWQGQAVPPLTDNSSMNPARAQGFNDAIETLFPMTPDMIRQFQQIYNNSQEAILSRPEPRAVIGAGMVSLEPGAAPPTLNVVPGIASVVTLFDATGQAWPIEQYIVGNGAAFQIIQLGENPNSFTVTPQVPVGWTNIVVKLAGEPTPVVLRVLVNKDSAHYRHDIQVLAMGPNAEPVMAATQADLGPRAGDAVLLAALTGVDLPPDARPVGVAGVAASAWMTSGDLYVRSRVPLISPSWTSSLAGPDGVRVYRMSPSPVLLFSNDGQVVRATVELP
jgi:intracellular multiplication protein IcmK